MILCQGFWRLLGLILILASFVDDDSSRELLLLGESRRRRRGPDEDVAIYPGRKTWTFQRGGFWYTPNTHFAICFGSGSEGSGLTEIFEAYLYKYFHLLFSPYNPI